MFALTLARRPAFAIDIGPGGRFVPFEDRESLNCDPSHPQDRVGWLPMGMREPSVSVIAQLPAWAEWVASTPYRVGVEEEVMILDPASGALAAGGAALDDLPRDLGERVHPETHQSAAELATTPHREASEVGREAGFLRRRLQSHLAEHGLALAAAGTHPLAVWTDIRVSEGPRYQIIHETMRELARREPTFALHVHIGVDTAPRALALLNRLVTHVPLLLALSANSPFWQGRDTGLSSARTSIFQAFPRTGLPQIYSTYEEYIEAIDRLVRTDAIPEPTFIWWDVRLQPGLGTVEVRIMDSQITADATAALAALVQIIAHLELEEGYCSDALQAAPEVLDENRFLAARDGMEAQLIDLEAGRRLPARGQLDHLLDQAHDHAEELGCADALSAVRDLSHASGAAWQRETAVSGGLDRVVPALIARFGESGGRRPHER
jgi:glutamate---cysteine ligase / carboxylate-amine ligase